MGIIVFSYNAGWRKIWIWQVFGHPQPHAHIPAMQSIGGRWISFCALSSLQLVFSFVRKTASQTLHALLHTTYGQSMSACCWLRESIRCLGLKAYILLKWQPKSTFDVKVEHVKRRVTKDSSKDRHDVFKLGATGQVLIKMKLLF